MGKSVAPYTSARCFECEQTFFLRISIFHKLEAGFQTCITLLFPHSNQFFI